MNVQKAKDIIKARRISVPLFKPGQSYLEARGYLKAVKKADKIFETIANGLYLDDHAMIRVALDGWEKRK